MIFTHLMGGLGNQLFQIFTALSYEIQTRNVALFPHSPNLGGRNTYWDTIFRTIKSKTAFSSDNEKKIRNAPLYREPGFHYTPLPTDCSAQHDFQITGYFQSWKYFHDHASQIVRLLELAELQQDVLSRFPQVCFPEDVRISMHFRLGDYKDKPECHPVMPLDYYQSALRKCLDELHDRGIQDDGITVLYFCENEDDDFVVSERICPLKVMFPTIRFSRILSSMTEWEQLLVMANSQHHIIANSSFSWWGAYLASRLQWEAESAKILQWGGNFHFPLVYFPSKWFGPARSSHCTDDMCPSYWLREPTVARPGAEPQS